MKPPRSCCQTCNVLSASPTNTVLVTAGNGFAPHPNTTTDELGPKPGGCNHYFVWEPGIYAQGPNALWRIWILNVNGVRVVVRADSFPDTTPQVQAQLKAIVSSIQIEP